jgi:hypothetical protein
MSKQLPTFEAKQRERAELNKLVSEFIARGGKIYSQSRQPEPQPPIPLRNPEDAGLKFARGHYGRTKPKFERRVPKPISVIARYLRRTREPKKRLRQPKKNPNPEWTRQQELKKLLMLQESGITYSEFRWAMNYDKLTNLSLPDIARKLKLVLVQQIWDQSCDALRFWYEEIQ